MTREEKIEKLNRIVKDSKLIDKNLVINKLADSTYNLENFTKITISKVKGSALSTATGKGLHNAIFDNRGRTVVITYKVNGESFCAHLNI